MVIALVTQLAAADIAVPDPCDHVTCDAGDRFVMCTREGCDALIARGGREVCATDRDVSRSPAFGYCVPRNESFQGSAAVVGHACDEAACGSLVTTTRWSQHEAFRRFGYHPICWGGGWSPDEAVLCGPAVDASPAPVESPREWAGACTPAVCDHAVGDVAVLCRGRACEKFSGDAVAYRHACTRDEPNPVDDGPTEVYCAVKSARRPEDTLSVWPGPDLFWPCAGVCRDHVAYTDVSQYRPLITHGYRFGCATVAARQVGPAILCRDERDERDAPRPVVPVRGARAPTMPEAMAVATGLLLTVLGRRVAV